MYFLGQEMRQGLPSVCFQQPIFFPWTKPTLGEPFGNHAGISLETILETKVPRGFHQGSTRVPPEFHQGSTRVPPGFHQGSTRVPPSARAAGWSGLFEVRFHEGLFAGWSVVEV